MTLTQPKTKTDATSRQRWLILAVICIPVFIGALDLTVVSAFLPELILELEIPLMTGLDDAAWIVSVYLLAFTVSLTFMGRVSDLFGRRIVYAICLVIFLIGSVLVATAHQWPTDFVYQMARRAGHRPDIAYINLYVIIFARGVQAFGAGALVPVSMALVGDLFSPAKRARPLGLIGAIDTLGWVLGHLYGGIFVQFVPWQWLFWVNVPLTIFAFVATWWALRDVPQHRVQGRFDFLGTLFIAGALIALNIGLGANIESGGDTTASQIPAYAVPLLTIAAICFLIFVLIEAKIRDPLINLQMFRKRNVSYGLLTNLFIGYCLFIGLVTVPILVNIRQESANTITDAALQVGLLLSALTVPMALAALPGGWLSDRVGYRRSISIGLGISMVGFLLIWQTWTLDVRDSVIVVEMALVGIGIGVTFSPISTSVINSASDDDRGVVSALVLILRLIGMTVSASSLTTIALNRVLHLANVELGADFINSAFETYPRLTAQVLAEFGLLGAIICVVAMIPTYLLEDEAVVDKKKYFDVDSEETSPCA
jgi:MFS family permease